MTQDSHCDEIPNRSIIDHRQHRESSCKMIRPSSAREALTIRELEERLLRLYRQLVQTKGEAEKLNLIVEIEDEKAQLQSLLKPF